MLHGNAWQRRVPLPSAAAIGACAAALLMALMLAGSAQAAVPATVVLGTAGQFAVL
jgi:hypothetical protein